MYFEVQTGCWLIKARKVRRGHLPLLTSNITRDLTRAQLHAVCVRCVHPLSALVWHTGTRVAPCFVCALRVPVDRGCQLNRSRQLQPPLLCSFLRYFVLSLTLSPSPPLRPPPPSLSLSLTQGTADRLAGPGGEPTLSVRFLAPSRPRSCTFLTPAHSRTFPLSHHLTLTPFSHLLTWHYCSHLVTLPPSISISHSRMIAAQECQLFFDRSRVRLTSTDSRKASVLDLWR